MFCIKCQSPSTYVINSRPSKKLPSIWRRRRCGDCGFTFTTREEVAPEDFIIIAGMPFSIPRLALSLLAYLPADKESADTAYWLSRTVAEQLIKRQRYALSVGELKLSTKEVLERYDPRAGLQYELTNRLSEVTKAPRRGRPRLKR